MDDFLERLLYSPAWMTDANDSSRSSWEGTALSNVNGLLSDLSQPFGGEKNRSICIFPSNATLLDAAAEDLNHHVNDGASSVMMNRDLKLSQQKLHSQNSLPTLMNSASHDKKFSLPGAVDGCERSGSFESTVNHRVLPISSSIESNESELSAFPQSFGDANSINSVPTLWRSSYPSISSVMGQGKLQDYGFHGIESNDNLTGKPSFENGRFFHLDVIPPASTHSQDSDEHNKYSSFSVGQQMHLSTGILPPRKEQSAVHLPSFPSLSQSALNKTNTGYPAISSGTQSHATTTNGNGGNGTGTVKQRVRARRGQATDPHSIAERLRREKIAERMKNLQELVPNSNKTDKASMLDEIIEYVKFLQLQVKVLSMSRLGAAGAVVPLLTDNQTEGSGTLLLSSPFGQDGADLSDSKDSLAFEQEVLKLMETNITNAMQYLQHKGLCLMPIALAAAIPSQKGNSTPSPPERKRTVITNSRNSYKYGERKSTEDEANVGNTNCLKQEAYKSMDDNKEMILKEKTIS